jgi:hypothetical protein
MSLCIYLRITQSQAIFQPGRLRIAIEDRRELWVKTRPLWAIAGGRRLGPSRLARASLSGSGGSGGSGGSSGSSGLWGGGLNLCRPNAGGRPLPLIAICSSGSVDALARPIEGHAHGFRSLGRWSRARWWCRPTILLHPTTVCHVALHDSNPAATVAPANGGCNVKCTAAHSISQQQKCQKGGRHVAHKPHALSWRRLKLVAQGLNRVDSRLRVCGGGVISARPVAARREGG